MNNSRGSTLAIAVTVVFLFAMLGAGAMNFGGAKRLYWTNQEENSQAFWLADGALEQALIKLTTNPPAGNYNSHTITMASNSNYCYTTTGGSSPYTVIATGNVGPLVNNATVFNQNSRTLQAVIENFNNLTHNSAAVYSGSIDHSGAVSAGSGGTALANGAVPNVNLDAQDVFGTSLSNVEALALPANTYYVNVSGHVNNLPPDPLVVSGITVIKTTTALTLNDVSSSGAGALLIIDTTGATSPEASKFIDVEVNLSGSSVFNGVFYVLGNLYLGKNVQFNGAVYVQGNLSFHDTGGGNGGVIVGNSSDIAGAGALLSNNLFINSWVEYQNTPCT